MAVILITHKLAEVLVDRRPVTAVLRQGRVAGQVTRAAATEASLVRLMFDKDLSSISVARLAAQAGGGHRCSSSPGRVPAGEGRR